MGPSKIKSLVLIATTLLLTVAPIANATSYTSDTNINDFTSLVTSYATLSNYTATECALGSSFTPTSSEIATTGCRVYNGGTASGLSGSDWILATFGTATSSIIVFPNIDHYGSAYDGYQYSIWGSNNGTSWTELFNAVSVTGAGEPFTLGTFTGTAPTTVNNVLTGGGGYYGTVGYEAQFNFGTAYTEYALGYSTEALNSGNTDQEISGVGSLTPTTAPEPGSLVLFSVGLTGLFALRRKIA